MSEVRSWTDPGPPPVEVVGASDYRDALAQIERLRAALQRASFYITAKMETTPQALAIHEELREALSNAHETFPVQGGDILPPSPAKPWKEAK